MNLSLALPRHAAKKASFLLAALALGVSGCTSSNLPSIPVSQANQELSGGYRLGPGDKLRVTVFDEANLSGEYEVGVGGTIALPLIQDIQAGGRTPKAVADEITAKLAQGGYVLNPRVAVEVLNYRPFYILGEVAKPGEYPYSGELSLLQAIAKAGGFTARANKSTVIVRRLGWTSARQVTVGDPPLLIAPGDTVTVTESLF